MLAALLTKKRAKAPFLPRQFEFFHAARKTLFIVIQVDSQSQLKKKGF
jgi:hypothetical protein